MRRRFHTTFVQAAVFISIFALILVAQPAKTFDVVLKGGRVVDPASGLDGIRNVGIRDGKIVRISKRPIAGRDILDVTGLVVSPGFIDLHAHGQTNKANEYQARDGVTTALELEGGVGNVAGWLKSRKDNALINYGASVAHSEIRAKAMNKYASLIAEIESITKTEGPQSPKLAPLYRQFAASGYESLTREELARMLDLVKQGLSEGALGIGVPVGYYPGATRTEIFRLYEYAAGQKSLIFTHVRDINVSAIQEAIADAAVNGTSLHIVHLNSMSLGKIETTLAMVENAQKRGLDITTELYPYTAASTSLESSLFDEGWQKRMGITYEDLQWQDSGERLTKESFEKYRKQGGVVIIHLMKPEWIEMGIKAPFTMIASDGMPFAPGAHPRSAGTFSRVLGLYVREKKALSLVDALRKMTIMPAKRLETISPGAAKKGRIQEGMDADITVFDPATIVDTATFKSGPSFSKGVRHVLVNGRFVVRDEENVEGVYPGRALRGKLMTDN
ncbi:MAG: amidohydrolase family protein [Pyrinomonadaceae bacterium]|nr:amidohydrolase family protein [Pyrinomonadaceae bacterium]